MAVKRELSRNEILIRNEVSIPDYYNQVIVPQRPGFFAISEGKRAGICPFHDERDPSFHYWSKKQFFHCFGCGTSGDVIFLHQKFMKEYDEYIIDLHRNYVQSIETNTRRMMEGTLKFNTDILRSKAIEIKDAQRDYKKDLYILDGLDEDQIS